MFYYIVQHLITILPYIESIKYVKHTNRSFHSTFFPFIGINDTYNLHMGEKLSMIRSLYSKRAKFVFIEQKTVCVVKSEISLFIEYEYPFFEFKFNFYVRLYPNFTLRDCIVMIGDRMSFKMWFFVESWLFPFNLRIVTVDVG